MEHNEISMFMDVKLDLHDKRALAQCYRNWHKCQVKIEAIKCVPCFLRLSFQNSAAEDAQQQKILSISVNIPGVNISLATSRTKQHSYGLYWTQNRHNCFIYFAFETESFCKRHMRWIKKSIKNLELYRQVILEQRRLSRGPSAALGPLPTLPDAFDLSTSSARISRVSQIYEEIFDNSRASIASGIYEEMKPSTEAAQKESPPVVPPPLPAHRKRINTFENSPLLGVIPRCSTNPESEMAKKKKYKNMLDNIFGSARQKRYGSVSEEVQVKETPISNPVTTPVLGQKPLLPLKRITGSNLNRSHRNSFSSPDLSKLNFMDTFGEAQVADLLHISAEESCADLNVNLNESIIAKLTNQMGGKADSLESLNVSEQLPHNFNFSACNSSTVNLMGAHGAVPPANPLKHKNKILVDDLTGYCVMAPIVKKMSSSLAAVPVQPLISTGSTSSGYSTGSYCSSTSSSCHNDEQKLAAQTEPKLTEITAQTLQNESGIYEAMHGSLLSTSGAQSTGANSGFAEHLYENLLAVKAAQELEQPLNYGLSTSTPTESPLLPTLPLKGTPKQVTPLPTDEEDYYQTPRKSIISVDEKVPSYYPNSCDTMKSKRRSPSTTDQSSSSGLNLKHLVSAKLRRERKENVYISSPQQVIGQRQKRSPAPTSSPSLSSASSSGLANFKTKTLTKKTAAHKISEGVYAVTHSPQNTNINNNNDVKVKPEVQQKMEEELLQLAMLKSIDFKFDDGQSKEAQKPEEMVKRSSPPGSILRPKLEDEYEHCYQAAEKATRLLQKYATLAKFGNSPTKSASPQHHQLQVNQTANIKAQQQSQSPAAAAAVMTQSVAISNELQTTTTTMKKFASLPRFKKIDFSPLKLRINNVLQRNQQTTSSSTESQ